MNRKWVNSTIGSIDIRLQRMEQQQKQMKEQQIHIVKGVQRMEEQNQRMEQQLNEILQQNEGLKNRMTEIGFSQAQE